MIGPLTTTASDFAVPLVLIEDGVFRPALCAECRKPVHRGDKFVIRVHALEALRTDIAKMFVAGAQTIRHRACERL